MAQTHIYHAQTGSKGFTLVELAIVMIIIGLLIGGVLKGQQLIENAKIKGTVAQVQAYTAALNSFKDTYSAFPGDMANAQLRLAGCGGMTAAGNFCQNGTGNGIVGEVLPAYNAGDLTVTGEIAQFWKHLALADLITGVNVASNTLAWGDLYPQSKLRGGFTVSYASCAGASCQASPSGFVLRLHNGLRTGGNVEDALGQAVASPVQAQQFDRILDDGIPYTGTVRSIAAGNGADVDQCEVAYSGETRKDCTLIFLIDG